MHTNTGAHMTTLSLNAPTRGTSKNGNDCAVYETQDMVIVGAGISGICAGYYYSTSCCDQEEMQNKNSSCSRNLKAALKPPLILERRAQLGGTWDLFNYPGIRSDSDMQTFSFPFHPWKSPISLGSAQQIIDYMNDTVKTHHLDTCIRYNSTVTNASWNSQEQCWTLVVGTTHSEHNGSRRGHRPHPSAPSIDLSIPPSIIKTRFLYLATGYYDYVKPYEPNIPGLTNFTGCVLHAQFWDESKLPDGLQGKRVAVIGSGATAITTVPGIVERGATKVYMVQRSPTYMIVVPSRNPYFGRFSKWLWLLPISTRCAIIRWIEVFVSWLLFQMARTFPARVRKFLLNGVRAKLTSTPLCRGKTARDDEVNQQKLDDVMVHFTPTYNVWDQRLCVLPSGDLLRAVGRGDAELVTGTIAGVEGRNIIVNDTAAVTAAAAKELDEKQHGKKTGSHHHVATKTGGQIQLKDIDVVVLCTGMDISLGGGVQLSVDGHIVQMPQEHQRIPQSFYDNHQIGKFSSSALDSYANDDTTIILYRTTMSPNVPNLFTVFGYVNAAWALKAGLIAEYVARLIRRMALAGSTSVTAPRPFCVSMSAGKSAQEKKKYVVDGKERTLQPFTDFSSGYIKRAADKGVMMMSIKGTAWESRNNFLIDLLDYKMASWFPSKLDASLKFE